MSVLVIFLPLLSAMVVGLGGRKLGKKGSSLVAVSLMSVTLLLALYSFVTIGLKGGKSVVKLFTWFDSGVLFCEWGFLFDAVSCVMLVVVTSISLLVHIYSIGYMGEDPHFCRFMSYLSFFTFFMLCLVTADNFIQMFLGWEGVGLASYLLINFWYTRVQANKAALKAVIVNRFGDVGLGIAIVVIFSVFKTVDMNCVFALSYAMSEHVINFCGFEVNSLSCIGLFLFIGAVGKSAQMGLHTWLPDAMEGPTPVSALIHAATMVTAGVYVLIRCSPLLNHSAFCLGLITIFGGLTAFFAGSIGIFQYDLKRVIAYSTCSQLGYMVFACGLSNYSASLFHLTNHAYFKALLFLSAGAVIHAVVDEQDMRKMGGLVKLLPFTFVMMSIGSLALMGFPFTSGYYSKDLILELGFSSYYVDGLFCYVLGVIGAFCTAFYSMRLVYMTFLAETNISKGVMAKVHDAPLVMAGPLGVLCIGSIFSGYVLRDMFVGLGTDFWGGAIEDWLGENVMLVLECEFLPTYIKILPIWVSLLGGLSAWVLYSYYQHKLVIYDLETWVLDWFKFFNKKWYFDLLYNNYIVNVALKSGYEVFFKLIDRGVIEFIGPTGLVRGGLKLTETVKKMSTGYVYQYIFIMVLGLISILYGVLYGLSQVNILVLVIWLVIIDNILQKR